MEARLWWTPQLLSESMLSYSRNFGGSSLLDGLVFTKDFVVAGRFFAEENGLWSFVGFSRGFGF